MVDCVLWLGDDGALIDFPVEKDAFDAGLKPGRVFFQRLPSVA